MAAKLINPNTENAQKNKRFDINTSTVSPTSKAGSSPSFSKDKGKTSKAIPHYIFESKDPNNDPTEDPKEEDFIDVHYGTNYFY